MPSPTIWVSIDNAGREAARRAKARVDADERSARASGVMITPTFFINGRRYDGPWDESSLADAMLGRLGHRVRSAALDFASWGPSAGMLLLVATVLARRAHQLGAGAGLCGVLGAGPRACRSAAPAFSMSFQHWVNDGLLTIFFLVVGLEIKREFTVGHLASRRAAALPVAGGDRRHGGPAVLLPVSSARTVGLGWGVPMATDTAFAVALIVMMGERVPIALRIFLTAAAIVDDIGAIVVVAVFYSGDLRLGYLAAAAALGRAGAAQPLPCLPAVAYAAGSRSGPAFTPAACTPRSPA